MKVLADGDDDIAFAFAVGAALGGIHLALQDGVDLGIGTRATGCDRAERSSGHESRGSHEHGDAKGPGFHFHGSLFFDPVLVLLFCRLTLLMFRV